MDDITTFPTLYKKSGKKIQQWDIAAHQKEDGAAFTQVTHGQTDGKKQSTTVSIKGKNIGKKNETTPYEQAVFDAESKWKKQQDGGYVLDPSGITEQVLPMLAHSYDKYKDQVTFPCWVSPKLDGVRAIAEVNQGSVKLYSRKGKRIDTAPYINQDLSHYPDGIYDGELYCHDIDFQTFISWTKKFCLQNHSRLEYHIFDVIGPGSFDDRFINVNLKETDQIKLVKCKVAKDHNDISLLQTEFVVEGYEGAMVRHGDCVYQQNKRSRQLLKVKDFITEEFEIIGAKENKGKLEGTCVFLLKTAQGAEFEALPDGNQEHREKLWRSHSDLIGKTATIKFFEWTDSDEPVPRFPIFIGVRDYE